MSSFAEVLQQIAGGQTYVELDEKLTEIVYAVRETRKVGELSLKLTIKPNGEYGVFVTDKITAKIPESNRGDTIFYVNSENQLTREDSRQPKLPLQHIAITRQAPLRTVDEYAPQRETVVYAPLNNEGAVANG